MSPTPMTIRNRKLRTVLRACRWAPTTTPSQDRIPISVVDEFAPLFKILSPAQILAHYQNGTQCLACRCPTPCSSVGCPGGLPAARRTFRRSPVSLNHRRTRNAGAATPTVEVVPPVPSALTDAGGDTAYGFHYRNGFG